LTYLTYPTHLTHPTYPTYLTYAEDERRATLTVFYENRAAASGTRLEQSWTPSLY
jgi:hypothetical protein